MKVVSLIQRRFYKFNQIMLFGVNTMSTGDIQDYFDAYKIKKMFWLSDYSCI